MLSDANAETARQVTESLTSLKVTASHAVVQGSTAIVVSQPAIDYTSPSVYGPLVVSVLGGIHLSMLIYDWIKAKIDKYKLSK